ncbi:unnamed protein product [Camellia sinensis]
MHSFSRTQQGGSEIMPLFNLLLKNKNNLLLLFTISAHFFQASAGFGNVGRKLFIANIPSSANPPSPPSQTTPLRPSIAIIVGVLTIILSIIFLLLLYCKHCKTGANGFSGRLPPSSSSRKNSGVDRTVIESLPMFRFGSLRGDKDGLECAVCLNRFEPTEVLKLLPKCKHAFHVECVDTWLDGHSTCPLCRYRVDPEDILLVGEDSGILGQKNEPLPPPQGSDEIQRSESLRRVSGRHSSAEDRRTGAKSENHHHHDGGGDAAAERRSLDSLDNRKKKNENKNRCEIVSVGCFENHQPRRDEILLAAPEEEEEEDQRHRLEHRIIISNAVDGGGEGGGLNHRWSDAQASEMLYLRTEMIMSDSRRFLGPSRGRQAELVAGVSGGSVIKGRSVSEITGFRRFGNSRRTRSYRHQQPPQCHHQWQWRWRRGREREEEEEERHEGVVSRWLAWISHHSHSHSQSQTQQTLPAVRSGSTASSLA